MRDSKSADMAWITQVSYVLTHGKLIKTRGRVVQELIGKRTMVDMRLPVVTLPNRKLNYGFMAAEALWILTGDMRAETITPYCKNLITYSDSTRVFQGAYGPRILEQMHYVVETLIGDPNSRQAVIEIWRPMPRASKDIPCTLSIQFLLRRGKINTIVTMRSSDLWLGLPYDIFNFTMVSAYLMASLRGQLELTLGDLIINHGSLHVYEDDIQKIREATFNGASSMVEYNGFNPVEYNVDHLLDMLAILRERKQPQFPNFFPGDVKWNPLPPRV